MGDLIKIAYTAADFEAGNTHEPSSPDHAHTAGIHVGDWQHRIECHGKNEQDAERLRDHVLSALKGADGLREQPHAWLATSMAGGPGGSSQRPAGSDLLQLQNLLTLFGLPFKRDRYEEKKTDVIIMEKHYPDHAKIDCYLGFYVAFEFDLEGNFIKVFIGE